MKKKNKDKRVISPEREAPPPIEWELPDIKDAWGDLPNIEWEDLPNFEWEKLPEIKIDLPDIKDIKIDLPTWEEMEKGINKPPKKGKKRGKKQ